MTDAEKVSTLRSAIERADRTLEWILAEPGHAEWMMTTAQRIRRILRAGLKRAGEEPGPTANRKDDKNLPKQNFKPWQMKGLTKELK